MYRRLSLILIAVIILALMLGCNNKALVEKGEEVAEETESQEAKTIKFCYQDGITALTAAKLAKENPTIDEDVIIEYEMQKSPDLLVSKVLKEEADIAIVPSNLAAQAYNKGIPYKIVGTATWGSMYLVSTEDIQDFEDLKGREIYAFGKGLTPDLVLRYTLAGNGIDPDEDVTITYLNSASEMGPAFLGGKTHLALLSEPLATAVLMKKEEAKIIFDLNEEWSSITGADKGYPQASLVVKWELIENNTEFVNKLIDYYVESRKWAEENPEKLAEYAEELEISVPKDVILEGIKWTNVDSFHIGDSMEEYRIYYESIMDFAPDFIGGNIPDEEIYFER